MEICLTQSYCLNYVREMNLFHSGIYFHTYTHNHKEGDKIWELNLGLFKFELGSNEAVKLYNQEVDNFFVAGNIIYLIDKNQNQVIELKINGTNAINSTHFTGLSYDYANNISILFKNGMDDQNIIFVNEKGPFNYAKTGLFLSEVSIENYILEEGISTGSWGNNDLQGYSKDGDELWKIRLSDVLDLNEETFNWNNRWLRVYTLNSELVVSLYESGRIICIDSTGHVLWTMLNSDIHTLNYDGDKIYALSNQHLSILDSFTGEVLHKVEISNLLEKYQWNLQRGGMWIYEDYIFLPSPKKEIEFIFFDKHTLIDLGRIILNNDKQDELIQIPGQYTNRFIYTNGKIYILDTANVLRVFDAVLNKILNY